MDVFAPTLVGARGRTKRPLSRDLGLVRELALTQFRLKYTGSALGYIWSMLKPAMLFGITYVIFAVVLKVGGDDKTFPMQLLLAIVVWTFFADATGNAMSSIAGNGNIIRKASFPRWTLVAAGTFSALVTFLINLLIVMLVATALGGLHLGWSTLLVPLLLIEFYLMLLGVSMLLASLFVFFRDVGHIWDITMQVLFYGSMICFPLTKLAKHATLKSIVFLNPIAQMVEDLRHSLVAPVTAPLTINVVGPVAFLAPLGLSVFALVLGALVFRRLSPRFAEYL